MWSYISTRRYARAAVLLAPLALLLTVWLIVNASPAPPATVPGDLHSPNQIVPTPNPAPVSTPPNAPNTFIFAGPLDPATLDPAADYEFAGAEIINNVYEPLLFRKRDTTDQFIPILAEQLPTISDNDKTYTFRIRKGIKFHEGQDLTAEDVAYTFWRGMIQDTAGGPQWMILQPFFGLDVQNFKDGVVAGQHNNNWAEACEAVKQAITYDSAAGTVTMHLKQTYDPFLQVLSGPWGSIVSKSWVAQVGGWNGECATAEMYHDPKAENNPLTRTMNGTGPYKLERWTAKQEISLLRNDNYWIKAPLWQGGPSGPASIQRVVLKNVDDWNTRLAMLKAYDADSIAVDQQYYSQLDSMLRQRCDYPTQACQPVNPSGFLDEYKGLPSNSAWYIPLNQQINPAGGNPRIGSGKLDGNGIPPDFFSDIHVRKAFNYSYDWDTFIKDYMHGDVEQVLGPIPNGVFGYDPSQPHYSFDLNKAAQEFKASTLKSPDGESLWDTGFYLQLVYPSGDANSPVQGRMLKENLAKINPRFRLEIAEEPWPALLSENGEKRLPMTTVGWLEDFHDPHDWVQPYLGSNGWASSFTRFPEDLQKELDGLILKAVQTTDAQERISIYGQLQNIAYDNALYIFTVQPHNRAYIPAWVRGWRSSEVTGMFGDYFYSLSKGP
jgi:peptide/nickel transport system substrate-binding protein